MVDTKQRMMKGWEPGITFKGIAHSDLVPLKTAPPPGGPSVDHAEYSSFSNRNIRILIQYGA